MKLLLLCGIFLLSACANNSVKQELINSDEHKWLYDNWQFSQAVKVGNQIWVSGQVGYDSENKNYPDNLLVQSHFAFKNLETVLKQAGASIDDVVSITTYHKDISKVADVIKSKSEFMNRNYSSWTAVEVSALAQPQLLFEVKAVAIIGSGKTKE